MGHIMDLSQPVTYGTYNGLITTWLHMGHIMDLTQPVTHGTYNGLNTTCYTWDI